MRADVFLFLQKASYVLNGGNCYAGGVCFNLCKADLVNRFTFGVLKMLWVEDQLMWLKLVGCRWILPLCFFVLGIWNSRSMFGKCSHANVCLFLLIGEYAKGNSGPIGCCLECCPSCRILAMLSGPSLLTSWVDLASVASAGTPFWRSNLASCCATSGPDAVRVQGNVLDNVISCCCCGCRLLMICWKSVTACVSVGRRQGSNVGPEV